MRGCALRRVVVLLMVVLVAGCGGGGGTPQAGRSLTPRPPAPPPRGVHLSFIQQRFDEGTRRADVRVENFTPHVLRVRSVDVDWPGFPGGPQRVDYPVPGGLTVDLHYMLPRPDCSQGAGRAPAFAVAISRGRTIRRPMPRDGMGFLTRLWHTNCNQMRIARAVDIGFADRWEEDGKKGLDAGMTAHLLVRRRGGEAPAEVTDVAGSLLFDLHKAGSGVLTEGADQVDVPVRVSPGRCDEHGRSQVTQTFVFRVWVSVAGSEPLVRNLVPTKRQQARMLAFIEHACG